MTTKYTSIYNLPIEEAVKNLKDVTRKTPLQYIDTLSIDFGANVFLKREDLQVVRSYKLRGAYNMISSLAANEVRNGVVCASAGNHAQGVAYSCNHMKIRGTIFMPLNTPRQKITQTKMFGNGHVEIKMVGDTFDDCATAAKEFAAANGKTFIPPFDDERVIAGQGTIGVEILNDMAGKPIDYLFIPVGGGGLCSGVGAYIREHSPNTKIVAVEPLGAACLSAALERGEPVRLDTVDKFVDGAAVQRIGDLTFPICRDVVTDVCLTPEGEVCSTILKLYNENAIVVEPAGALSMAALNHYRDVIRGKNVVCIVSGSNNDIDRMQEIKELSMRFEGLKHYFIIRFAQRSNALKNFVNNILGSSDDIVRFEYMKKNQKEYGPALVGVELDTRDAYASLIARMDEQKIDYTVLDPDSDLGRYIV